MIKLAVSRQKFGGIYTLISAIATMKAVQSSLQHIASEILCVYHEL